MTMLVSPILVHQINTNFHLLFFPLIETAFFLKQHGVYFPLNCVQQYFPICVLKKHVLMKVITYEHLGQFVLDNVLL